MKVSIKVVDCCLVINAAINKFNQDIQDYGAEESDFLTRTVCRGERGLFGNLGSLHSAVFEYEGHVERLAFSAVLTGREQTAGDIAYRLTLRIKVVQAWVSGCLEEDYRRGLMYEDSF